MKFNISNNENQIVFTFECDANDPMISVLLDVIKPKPDAAPKVIEDPSVVEEVVVIKPQPRTITRRPRRTKAEMAQTSTTPDTSNDVSENQLNLPFIEEELNTKPVIEPVTPQTENQTIILSDKDKADMDVEVLKLKMDDDNLGAIKLVKSKTGVDLATAKTYCDDLWNKHLKE